MKPQATQAGKDSHHHAREKSTGAEPAEARPGTFGALAEAYLKRRPDIVESIITRTCRDRLSPFQVIDASKARRADRGDMVSPEDEIEYRDFSPPALWQAPYSVLHATFTGKEKQKLMTHCGEELLVPVVGKIEYDFWVYSGAEMQAARLRKQCATGQICRINPAIPHHTRAVGDRAEAWMLFRGCGETLAAVRRDEPLKSQLTAKNTHPRSWSDDELRSKPCRYWLPATGIAEKIRLFRRRSDMQIQELAEACHLDRGFLSRVEGGDVNLSLGNLIRIAEVLGFDPFEGLEEAFWYYRLHRLSESNTAAELSEVSGRESRHLLHVRHHKLESAETKTISKPKRAPIGAMCSWIALNGKVEFEGLLQDHNRSGFLRSGSVIHLRQPMELRIQAFEPSELLEVCYSSLVPDWDLR